MPAGKSEPVGQCAVLRNVERAEAPVLPVVKPKQMERTRNISAPLAGTMGKAGNVLRKITLLMIFYSSTHTCARVPGRLAADWTKIWTEA